MEQVEEKRKFSFQDVRATQRIFELDRRIRAVSGGTSSSKTISIIVWLIDYCQSTQNKLCTVVSESYPHLEKGAMLDFENIMKDRGYWKESLWHKTKHTYTFETGSKLEFFSVDSYGKAHGPRRDVLFVNECNNLDYKIVDQLITRTREIVWLDWNPSEEFWFYTEMFPSRPDDIDFVGDGGNYPPLTYLDNEALDDVMIAEIESHKKNKSWWDVYGLGKLGATEQRIYKNWNIIDEVPFEARLERYGIDFGYTNDPTAIIALYYYNGGYIIDEIAYEKGLLNKQIADIIKNQEAKAIAIGDSAEPKSIDEIRLNGITILPSVKGRDSVSQGIQYVQGQQISVTKRSINVIKEYRRYLWLTDKDGKILNEPDHMFSHSMDAVRYALVSIKNPNHNTAYTHYPGATAQPRNNLNAFQKISTETLPPELKEEKKFAYVHRPRL